MPDLLAPAPPVVRSQTLSVTIAGYAEVNAQPGDFKFASGNVQDFTHPQTFGSQVLAAFPVIRDYHADVPHYRRWWREWGG